jgi:hypothetical protein
MHVDQHQTFGVLREYKDAVQLRQRKTKWKFILRQCLRSAA